MRARLTAGLFALLASACGSEEPRPVPIEPAAATPPEPAPPAPRPWAVRYVRGCSEWASNRLQLTERHVFACDGAAFDRETGRVVRGRGDYELVVGAHGERSVWRADGVDALRVRDASLADRVVPLPERGHLVTLAPDGQSVALLGARAAYRVSLADGHAVVVDPSRCEGASALGFRADGSIECVRDRRLITVGEPTTPSPERIVDAPLTALHWTRFDPRGGRLVGMNDERLYFIDDDGETIASRPVEPEARLLDVAPDGSALLSLDGRTERWTLEGDAIEVETVYGRAARHGELSDDAAILSLSSTVVWLHRGPARTPPAAAAPDAPEGYETMRTDAERQWVGRGGTFPRNADDLTAFTGPGFIRVSVSDADELGGLDGEAWARAAMGRYVVAGSDRWARWWREDGQHILRGHTYIGGCERTDVDVLVRERDGYVERWVAYATDLDAALGAPPSGARAVTDGVPDGWAGDPSVGRVE